MLVARAASRNTDRAPETELQLVVVLGWGWGGPATCQGRGPPGAARGAHPHVHVHGVHASCGIRGFLVHVVSRVRTSVFLFVTRGFSVRSRATLDLVESVHDILASEGFTHHRDPAPHCHPSLSTLHYSTVPSYGNGAPLALQIQSTNI